MSDDVPPPRTVRLTIPARLSFDLDAMKAALGELAVRTGHPNCMSGCDFRIVLTRGMVERPGIADGVEIGPIDLPGTRPDRRG